MFANFSPENTMDPISGLKEPWRTIAIGSILSAMVLVVLDAATTNVALPTIARSLQVSSASSILVITVYQTALLMALFPCAALGESFGHRRIFSAGVGLFTAASLMCALSPSLPWLVAARFVQGVGGAAVMALGVAQLRTIVSRRQLGDAIGWNALAVALSSAAGPAIGAAVLSVTSWRWLFAVSLSLGTIVLLMTHTLPESAGTGRRLDLVSVFLNAGSFGSLIIGSDLLPTRPGLATAMFAMTIFQLAVLVRRENPKETPLIPLDLLRNDSFRVSVIASAFCFAGQTAGMIALPFYLQHNLGMDAWNTGLFLTPWPLTVAILAPLSGRLSDRVPAGRLCAIGATGLTIGLCASSLWPLKDDPFPLIPFSILCGLGFSLFNIANNRNMFLSAPPVRSGAAGGMQGTARLSGQTAGAVLMTLLFSLTPLDKAPQTGLAIGATLTFLSGLVSMSRNTAKMLKAKNKGD